MHSIEEVIRSKEFMLQVVLFRLGSVKSCHVCTMFVVFHGEDSLLVSQT